MATKKSILFVVVAVLVAAGTVCDALHITEINVTLPGDVPLTLVYLPPGTFMMGSPADERGRRDREDLHEVTLTQGYYLGKDEVTQAQWEAVMGSLPQLNCEGATYGVGPEHPVYCVSWDEINGAGGFIDQLDAHLIATGQPGVGLFRLPTDAEWERAARAGTQTRFGHGDVLECGDECESCSVHDQFMWWCGNATESEPVGWKDANGFGLHDMHGNVWEWVHDRYTTHLGYDPQIDPMGPETGINRIIRGGGWASWARICRSGQRNEYPPYSPGGALGFRLARSLEPPLFADSFESGDTSAWSASVP